MELALTLNSAHTKTTLMSLHPNIKVTFSVIRKSQYKCESLSFFIHTGPFGFVIIVTLNKEDKIFLSTREQDYSILLKVIILEEGWKIACSRLSVSGDDRKSGWATSGVWESKGEALPPFLLLDPVGC